MASIDELISEGLRLLDLSQPGEALSRFREAVEQQPQNESLYLHWRHAILKLGGPAEELAAYRKAVEDNLDSANSEYDLGRLYTELEQYHHAGHWFKRAVEREEPGFNYLNTYISWGYCLYKEKEYARAISRFKKAIEIDPANELAFRNWRLAIKELDDPAEEIRYYQKKIETNLHQAKAYADLGMMLTDMERYPEAIESLQRAWQLQEKDFDYAEVLSFWGFCLQKLHDVDGAIDKYRKAYPITSDKALLFSNWQVAILDVQQPAHLVEEFTAIIETDYPTADGYHKAAYLRIFTREYDTAVKYFEKAVAQKDPEYNYSSLYLNWGHTLASKQCFKEAIEKFKKAVEADPDNELAYSNWAYTLNPASSEKDLSDFRKKIAGKLDKAAFNVYLGVALNNLRKNDEAVRYLQKATELDKKMADAWYNLGNALSSAFRYEEALDAYREAMLVQGNYGYASHNSAHLFEKLGRYRQSREEWKKTIAIYSSMQEDRYAAGDSDFFLYFGSIYHEAFKELNQAEKLYLRGLQLSEGNPMLLLALTRLYFLKKSEAIESGDESGKARNEAHTRAWQYFHMAEATLRSRIDGGEPNASMLVALGELYLTVEKLQEARTAFEKAAALDPLNAGAVAGLGVALIKSDSPREALRCFSDALVQDPDNLTLKNNYAEALLKAERIFEAEKAYHDIQTISTHHVESLVGLAEIYKRFGDTALERGIKGDAEEMFNQADYYYNRILSLHDHPERASKVMTAAELSSLFYSKGYVNVKMYELNRNTMHLQVARTNFKKVSPVGNDYYKARRAISKIDERTRSVREASSRFGAVIIIFFAILLLLAAQWVFFVGRPIVEREKYVFNTEVTRLLNTEDTLDLSILTRLRPILKETYYSREHMDDAINKVLSDQEYERLAELPHFTAGGSIRLSGFDPIDTTTYGLLTFGALIFIATGIYLKEITKLKFGVIEMEKSTFDQISTTTTMEISQGSSTS